MAWRLGSYCNADTGFVCGGGEDGIEGVGGTSLKLEEMPQLGSEQSQKLSGKLRSNKPNRESNPL